MPNEFPTDPKDAAEKIQGLGHDLSPAEKDTYNVLPRDEKERLPKDEVQEHWKARAKRPGVQSVMSARHSLEENERATETLKQEVLEFIGPLDGQEVFELGVGIGRMTEELAKRAKKVEGIDLTPEMVDKAKENLKDFQNVSLHLGRITDLQLPEQSYDLVFESIVLLHITNPEELKATIEKMKQLSRRVVIVEHTQDPEQPDLQGSKFSIFRDPKEYEELFKPYTLKKHKDTRCAGDRFTIMEFEGLG